MDYFMVKMNGNEATKIVNKIELDKIIDRLRRLYELHHYWI